MVGTQIIRRVRFVFVCVHNKSDTHSIAKKSWRGKTKKTKRMKEREREGEGDREREKERAREKERKSEREAPWYAVWLQSENVLVSFVNNNNRPWKDAQAYTRMDQKPSAI